MYDVVRGETLPVQCVQDQLRPMVKMAASRQSRRLELLHHYTVSLHSSRQFASATWQRAIQLATNTYTHLTDLPDLSLLQLGCLHEGLAPETAWSIVACPVAPADHKLHAHILTNKLEMLSKPRGIKCARSCTRVVVCTERRSMSCHACTPQTLMGLVKQQVI